MVGKQRSTAWIDFAITTKVLLVASPVATETSKLQYTVFVRMIEAKLAPHVSKPGFEKSSGSQYGSTKITKVLKLNAPDAINQLYVSLEKTAQKTWTQQKHNRQRRRTSGNLSCK